MRFCLLGFQVSLNDGCQTEVVYKCGAVSCSFKVITHLSITNTRLFKYIENFTTKKGKFSAKTKSDIVFIFLLKI